MNKSFLASLLAFTVIVTFATDASARRVKKSRSIDKDPETYAAEMARWHFIHQRDRKALQTAIKQFPTIQAALSINTQELTTKQRFQRANEDEGWITSDALGTTLAAILFSDGKYAVSKRANKQRAAQQRQTLAIAESMIEHLRSKRSGDFEDESWATFNRQVLVRARISLAKREYNDVVRDLMRVHPSLTGLITASDAKSFEEALAPLDDRMKSATEALIVAVLRSKGSVALTPDNKTANSLAWAIMAADHGEFDSPELMADALAAQPDKRGEYYKFVMQTAIADDFSTAWGWQHVQRVTNEMNKRSIETIEMHEQWEKEEKPSRKQPENSCG